MSARHTALREYRRKRDFSVTPEPPGTARETEGRSFVVHVVVPLDPGSGWDELAAFARSVALDLERQEPDAYTTTMSKARRRGKVFIDFMRNYRGASSVAAYSTRAREGAPVSAPLRWDELSAELRSDHFTIANLGKRVATLKADPWAGYRATRQRITPNHRKALGRG